jgi:hypothetical protein
VPMWTSSFHNLERKWDQLFSAIDNFRSWRREWVIIMTFLIPCGNIILIVHEVQRVCRLCLDCYLWPEITIGLLDHEYGLINVSMFMQYGGGVQISTF